MSYKYGNDDFYDDMLDEIAGGYQPSSVTRGGTVSKPQPKHQEVDDLLDFIDNTTSKPTTKPNPRPSTSHPQPQYTNTADNFFNDLDDNFLDNQAPVLPSRRQRPETAQPTLGDSAKNKMAELFGVKTVSHPPATSPQQKDDEINTLEIGASRRNRGRMLSKKEDGDSRDKSLKDTNQPEDAGSVIEDFQEITSKSRMRPPLSKKGVPAVTTSTTRNRGESLNHSNHSKNDLDVSPQNDNIFKTQNDNYKSYNDLGGERSFDKMSGLLQEDSAINPPPMLKQVGDKLNNRYQTDDQSANQQIVKALQKQIEFLEQQVKDVKKEKEDQATQLNLIHQQQLETERKTRVDLVGQLQEMMEKERKRMLEQQHDEVERVRKDCEMDKQRALELIKHEPTTIKQQIESQYKLNELADQLKSHSSNLHLLQKQIEHNTALAQSDREHQLSLREQTVVELERKLQSDINSIQEEKLRISHMYDDLKQRQTSLDQQTEVEKGSIRSEFKRLGEMQEQIRMMEAQSRKLIQMEKDSLAISKLDFDKQQSSLTQDYLQKLKNLDIDREAFENQKQQFHQFSAQNNDVFKRKFQELDETQQRLAAKETELISKQRQTDLKEHEISQMYNSLQRKLQLLDVQTGELHHKMREITEKEAQVKNDFNEMKDFRNNHHGEREEIEKKRQELALRDKRIQQEKLQLEQEKQHINIMHQTLSNLRSEMVSTNQGFIQTAPELMGQRPLVLTANNFNKGNAIAAAQPKLSKSRPEGARAMQNSSKFDVNGYVNYLKKVDLGTSKNQSYHLKERGQLGSSSGFMDSKF